MLKPCEKGMNCRFETFDYLENTNICSIDYDGEACPYIKPWGMTRFLADHNKDEKERPRVPVKHHESGTRFNYCPTCESKLGYGEKRCWKCNQRIDWEHGRMTEDGALWIQHGEKGCKPCF